MSDIDTSAMDRRSEPIVARHPDDATEPVLVMRPESFFSMRFRLHTGGRQASDGPGDPPARPPAAPERPIEIGLLLLMILLIGVPLLVYCILSTTG